jgi:hypothetical protein
VHQRCVTFGELEPPSPDSSLATGSEDDAAGKAMVAWVIERGGKTCVQSAAFKGGLRGAAATRDVGIGEVCVEVPRELLIYSDVIKATPMGQVIIIMINMCMPNN